MGELPEEGMGRDLRSANERGAEGPAARRHTHTLRGGGSRYGYVRRGPRVAGRGPRGDEGWVPGRGPGRGRRRADFLALYIYEQKNRKKTDIFVGDAG